MTITDDQLFEAIRKVATAAPETIYSRTVPDHQVSGPLAVACFYVHTDTDGNPVSAGCLIGKALHSLGVSLETLAVHETEPAQLMLSELNIGSDTARTIARNVQVRQDTGATWGECLADLPKTEATA